MTTTTTLRLSYSGKPGAWTAVLRAKSRVVASCGHAHRNRADGVDNAHICGVHHVIAARTKHSAELLTEKALAAACLVDIARAWLKTVSSTDEPGDLG